MQIILVNFTKDFKFLCAFYLVKISYVNIWPSILHNLVVDGIIIL